MEIHNLMEDEVLRVLDEICEEDEKSHSYGYCTSSECRMDVACFVLNRVPQQYVTSGRGIGYVKSEFRENTQLAVDLVTLAHEGLRRVTTNRRAWYEPAQQEAKILPEGPQFGFPAMRGRLFDCLTFAPAYGVDVWMYRDGSPVPMINSRWQNPCGLVENSSGSYLFWPAPVPAASVQERRTFEFELRIEETGTYEAFHHFFKMEAIAAESEGQASNLGRDFQLQDLFLVPR